jgi:predicted dehydrogenase
MARRKHSVPAQAFEAHFHFLHCEIFVPRYRVANSADCAQNSAWEVGVTKYGVLGISFDHMHMGDLLRQVAEHPDAEIAGIFDPDRKRMETAIATFDIPGERVFVNLDTCLSKTNADLAIICSATAEHANTVEKIAPHGMHVLIEKPFAASAGDARRIIKAMQGTGRQLAVNWPLVP